MSRPTQTRQMSLRFPLHVPLELRKSPDQWFGICQIRDVRVWADRRALATDAAIDHLMVEHEAVTEP
ncbi:MAG TPA: hypothetical protein VFN75_06360 [Pseudonocardiaceae bacterium]|nr:hypothetical protein [Pseudonocardiaceae bacterium]